MGSLPIGASTWIFGNAHLETIVAKCSKLELSCIELFVDIQRINADQIRDLCAAWNVRVVSMTPENVDIGHIDSTIRDSAVTYYQKLISFASRVGAPAITCHEYVGRNCPHDSPHKEWTRLMESCQRLAEIAEQSSIDILFEALSSTLVSSAPDLAKVDELVRTVDSSRIKIMLDTYHLFRQESDSLGAVMASGENIAAVQLADHRRRGLGQGVDHSRLKSCLNNLVTRGFRGPWILECSRELQGPSLNAGSVDLADLETDLSASMDWLQSEGLLDG